MPSKMRVAVAALAAATILAGCGGKGAPATMPSGTMSLVDQLGGTRKLGEVAAVFEDKLSKVPGVSSFLSPQDVQNVSTGLVHTITKMSGLAPAEGPDLAGALAGKKLDATQFGAISSSLQGAATSVGYNEAQTKSLLAVLDPIKKSLGL